MNWFCCPKCGTEAVPYCNRSSGGAAFECANDDCLHEWETDVDGEIIS